MYVYATEFRTNVGKYLDIAAKEDVFIIKHGTPIAVLSSNLTSKQRILDSLAGSYHYDGNLEELLEKRLEEL